MRLLPESAASPRLGARKQSVARSVECRLGLRKVTFKRVHGLRGNPPSHAPIFWLISSPSFLHLKSSGSWPSKDPRPTELSSRLFPVSGTTRVSVRQNIYHMEHSTWNLTRCSINTISPHEANADWLFGSFPLTCLERSRQGLGMSLQKAPRPWTEGCNGRRETTY